MTLTLLLLPRHAGWGPALAFAISYSVGAVVVLIVGPRLFRREARRRSA